jgi:hypothetical protein
VYIEQKCPSTDTRVKEHHHHICLEHPVDIKLWDTSTLSTTSSYMYCIIREITETKLHPKTGTGNMASV